MKIVFNDAAELQVQKVYIDASGALRIKTISATQEEIKAMFSDPIKTKNIKVFEREQLVIEYENYTQFDGIMSYTAGFLEAVLFRVGESPEEILAKLQADNATLKEQNEMLTECILEMSMVVYQ